MPWAPRWRKSAAAAVTISTKVGRIVDPATGAWHYDYSRDGVLRSLESSFGRLQRDHVDIVYVHDPDDHAAEASATRHPALLHCATRASLAPSAWA